MTLTLPNQGVNSHNVAADALGVSVDIAPEKTQMANFSAAGEHEHFCNVAGHNAAGMGGTMSVE